MSETQAKTLFTQKNITTAIVIIIGLILVYYVLNNQSSQNENFHTEEKKGVDDINYKLHQLDLCDSQSCMISERFGNTNFY